MRCVHARSGVAMVRRVCLEARKDSASRVSVSPVEVQAIPPRRFAPELLARIALASPTIACECPHHLVELITSLDAFEKYSEECEDRSPQDARLHALLHSIAASARALLETGLERVMEADGIKLDAH